jgi:hypothetical protein
VFQNYLSDLKMDRQKLRQLQDFVDESENRRNKETKNSLEAASSCFRNSKSSRATPKKVNRALLELTLSKDQKRALQERLSTKENYQKVTSKNPSNLLAVFHGAFEQLIKNRSFSDSLENYEEKWTACFIKTVEQFKLIKNEDNESGKTSDELFVKALGEILVQERTSGLDKILKYNQIYQVGN